jgi:hypothetical protein
MLLQRSQYHYLFASSELVLAVHLYAFKLVLKWDRYLHDVNSFASQRTHDLVRMLVGLPFINAFKTKDVSTLRAFSWVL